MLWAPAICFLNGWVGLFCTCSTPWCAWNAGVQWVWQTYCRGTGAVTAERNPGHTGCGGESGFFTLFFFYLFCALAVSCTVTLPHALKCLVCVHTSRSGCGCFSNTFRMHSATFPMSCKKLSWNPLARCLFNTVCLNRNFTGAVCCLCIKFYLTAHKIVIWWIS